MPSKPPDSFISIAEAYGKRDSLPLNIIGVCSDFLPQAKSRGTDYTTKLHLWDESCRGAPNLDPDGLLVRYFHKETSGLPAIENAGDIVLLHNIKLKNLGSSWLAMSNHDTTWTVVSMTVLIGSADAESLAKIECRSGGKVGAIVPKPDLQQLKYAQSMLYMKNPDSLRASAKRTSLDVAGTIASGGGVAPSVREKFKLFKELCDPQSIRGNQFADLLGEVRKVYDSANNVVEVQLTDYTEHRLLREYTKPETGKDGDKFGYIKPKEFWHGPYGRMVMTIMAWDEHGSYVRQLMRGQQIELGMYMKLKNVQIKMDKNGGQLEGHLRGSGSSFGSGISLHRPREAEFDDKIKALLQRKREYKLNSQAEGTGMHQVDGSAEKRKADVQAPDDVQKPAKKSKKAKKRERERREAEAAAAEVAKLPANQHVKTQAIDIPLSSIASILDLESLARKTPAGNPYYLPFQNNKYKAKVEVIDFFPDNIEDFATPYRLSEYSVLEDYDSADDEEVSFEFAATNPKAVWWSWHFVLFVRDPPRSSAEKGDNKDIMLLQVHSKEGDHLLRAEACDLRKEPQELAKLKEKLFVLWGDLAERKIAGGRHEDMQIEAGT
ncbi:hypothetical protein LTR66_015009 [Elasticomyces elasticus]|nr:hypothetical protein LTR66_015009 [Elasticomyces elasticus]